MVTTTGHESVNRTKPTSNHMDLIVCHRVVVGLVAVAMLGCAGRSHATASPPNGSDAVAIDGVARLRNATRSFRVLDSAVAAGYPREVADCIVHEHHGAMGYHHVNRSYVDDKLEPERPEILLYERRPDGSYKLNGAEFVLPFRFYSRDSVAPVFMGQKLSREDNLKYWYLHVWAWTENPDGLFANFNPDVTCAADRAKVYVPTPP